MIRPAFFPAVAVAGLVALLVAGCSGAPTAAPVSWPFDDAASGGAPAGWTFAYTGQGGDAGWVVAADAAAPSAPQVLRMTHARGTGSVYNVGLLRENTFVDVDMSVRVRADSGREDQGGGVVWRAADADNYYVCRLNPLELNLRVYKVVGGVRTQLGSADVDADPGVWYEVRAVMEGDRIRCFVDGRQHLEVRDGTFAGGGMVGVWTKADAASSFDDFIVRVR